jgi:hypothetical protein
MSKIYSSPLLACLLAIAGLAAFSPPVLANIESECRQEAEEFGIAPEEQQNYISDCVLSRGGDNIPAPEMEVYTPPAEEEMADNAVTGSGNVTE